MLPTTWCFDVPHDMFPTTWSFFVTHDMYPTTCKSVPHDMVFSCNTRHKYSYTRHAPTTCTHDICDTRHGQCHPRHRLRGATPSHLCSWEHVVGCIACRGSVEWVQTSCVHHVVGANVVGYMSWGSYLCRGCMSWVHFPPYLCRGQQMSWGTCYPRHLWCSPRHPHVVGVCRG